MAVKKLKIKPPKKGRQLIIGDIHGCKKTLEALLFKLDLRTWDQLIFVGDYLNKGPDSKGVLDTLMELKENNYQVYFIRGNNESLVLKTLKKSEYRILRLLQRLKIEGLFKFEGSKIKMRKKYHKFLKNTVHYIESDGFYAVHAGFDFRSETPFKDTYAMMWLRNYKANRKEQKSKAVVFGHTVTPIEKIRKALRKESLAFPIDNGCVLGGRKDAYGRLICLDFTNLKLIEQPNVEPVYELEVN